MLKTLIALACTAATGLAAAQTTPVGLWKTIDDESKTEKSQVRITESGGVLVGKIEKIADATKQDAKCELCTDERKDKPVLGAGIKIDQQHRNADIDRVGGDLRAPHAGAKRQPCAV